MQTVTSADAQNRFGELLDTAQREPVGITRRGRVVAFVLSPHEYEALAGGRATAHSAALAATARSVVAVFRGSGSGGAATRLVADRMAERSVGRVLAAPATAPAKPARRKPRRA